MNRSIIWHGSNYNYEVDSLAEQQKSKPCIHCAILTISMTLKRRTERRLSFSISIFSQRASDWKSVGSSWDSHRPSMTISHHRSIQYPSVQIGRLYNGKALWQDDHRPYNGCRLHWTTFETLEWLFGDLSLGPIDQRRGDYEPGNQRLHHSHQSIHMVVEDGGRTSDHRHHLLQRDRIQCVF